MKNSIFDIKYVDLINFIIVDFLQPVLRAVLVFDMK